VTFTQNLKKEISDPWLFRLGIIMLSIAVLLQLMVAFVNAIASGFKWDSDLDPENLAARKSLRAWGRFGSMLLVVSILSAVFGAGASLFFVNVNIA
jgi:hypothetical protein